MPALLHPTLVVAVGPFGRAVASRLAEDVAALPDVERARLATLSVPSPAELQKAGGPADPLAQLEADVAARLKELLRAGTGSGQPQLDLAIAADLLEIDGTVLVAVANSVSQVLARQFAVLFPPGLPAHQRTVWLNVLLGAPALADTDAGRAAIQAIGRLEQWHFQSPPSPCLSRIWLAPRQTASGVLGDEDVLREVYLFASTAYLCGQRQSDALRARLEPPRDPAKIVGTFAVAAADVPVGRILDYCTWRTALAGLELLATQAESQQSDDNAVDAAMGPLGADQWLVTLEEGDAARALRARAVAAAPKRLVKARPTPPGLMEAGDAAVARYEEFLADDPSTRPGGDAPSAPTETDAALRAADLAEVQAIDDAFAAVNKLLEQRLAPEESLRTLGLLHRGLGRVAERFEKLANAPAPEPIASQKPDEKQADTAPNTATDVRSAAARKPSFLAALPAAIGLGAAVAVAVAGILAVVSMRQIAATAPTTNGPAIKSVGGAGLSGASLASLLGPGIGAGIVVAIGWLAGSLAIATTGLKKALTAHEAAGTDRAASGSSPASTAMRGADTSLAARRRRAARTIARGLREKQERLTAIRVALQSARKKARDELARLGVQPGTTISDDQAADLLAKQTPLHWPLYPASALPLLCQRTRAVRDDGVWSQRMLEAGWPAGGIANDLPFCDVDPWSKVSRAQHGVLTEAGPFEWPDVGALLPTRVAEFLRDAPGALAFGVRPMREDGSRIVLQGEGELVAVAPGDARPAVDAANRTGQMPPLTWLWSPGSAPRLVVLTTGTDFDAASAWRGLGR